MKEYFKKEKGIDGFFEELERMVSLTRDLYLWHPEYLVGEEKSRILQRWDDAYLLKDAILKYGGTIRLKAPVREICIKNRRISGVKTADGGIFQSHWVVSNADYKRTFLELIDQRHVPKAFLSVIKEIPYTSSELCVYLGIDPHKADLSRMRAIHLYYRHRMEAGRRIDPEDMDGREIEICLWSDNAPFLVPNGKAALVLRVSFPFHYFTGFRTGEKSRKEGYQEYKQRLAKSLINTAEKILPGLSAAVETMDAATPLTYLDWGQRYEGSIAGWTWGAKHKGMSDGRLMLETPIRNLLMVGIYAASELFLGGVATSMHTGSLASDLVLAKNEDHA